MKGISTGDFEEALAALLCKDAPRLSTSSIARLNESWLHEHNCWKKRDLSARRYVYAWRTASICKRGPSRESGSARKLKEKNHLAG